MKSRAKGFTITELVIVIAIIAILSAITIPTISGYMRKTKIYNDITTASQMTKYISYYLSSDNNEEINEDDINSIYKVLYKVSSGQVVKYEDGVYKLIECESAKYGYNFWYNTEKNSIEVINDSDYIDDSLINLSNSDILESLESFAWNSKFPYLLLSTSGTMISDYLFNIKNNSNIKELEEALKASASTDNLLIRKLRSKIDEYAFITPEITEGTNIYVPNKDKAKRLYYTTNENGEVANRIITNKENNLNDLFFKSIVINKSIKRIDAGTFYLSQINRIVIEDENVDTIDEVAKMFSLFSINANTIIETKDNNEYYLKNEFSLISEEDNLEQALYLEYENNYLIKILDVLENLNNLNVDESNLFSKDIHSKLSNNSIIESIYEIEELFNNLSQYEKYVYENARNFIVSENKIIYSEDINDLLTNKFEYLKRYVDLKDKGIKAINSLNEVLIKNDKMLFSGVEGVANMNLEELFSNCNIYNFKIDDLIIVKIDDNMLRKSSECVYNLYEIGTSEIDFCSKFFIEDNQFMYEKEMASIRTLCYSPIDKISLELTEQFYDQSSGVIPITISFDYMDPQYIDDVIENVKTRVQLAGYDKNGNSVVLNCDYNKYDEYSYYDNQNGSGIFIIEAMFKEDLDEINIMAVLDGYDVVYEILTIDYIK